MAVGNLTRLVLPEYKDAVTAEKREAFVPLLGRKDEATPLAFEESALFDKREQLEKLEGVLLEGEQVLACLDMKGGGSGFIGMTDRRVVVYDKAFLAKMKAIVSIPYREIVTVAAQDSDRLGRGYFGSSVLALTARNGQSYTFEFRTSEKAHAAHTMLLERILD
jgi:hypothetical protein